jgi:hypothetical protein
MTPDARISLIRIKVERAEKHFRELEAEVQLFLNSQPYKVAAKRNPETRQLIYYLESVLDIPTIIAAITGDVLQNLRSALDHLAYHLVVIGTGGNGPFRHTYFPISDDGTKYKNEKPAKVKGMRQEAIQAIDALKPHRGGNDLLWRIHKLNNVDKHRLVLTTGSAFRSFNIGSTMNQMLKQSMLNAGNANAGNLPMLNLFLRPADRMFPLKAGDELFIDAPDAEVNEQMQFLFDVAFGEPQVVDGEALLDTLKRMIELVDNIILSFRPLLI